MATALFLVYAYSITIAAHLAPASFIAAQMFLFLQSVASLVVLTHMFENIDVTCRVRWRKRLERINPAPGFLPMVSLHLPAYDEPPEIVEATLRALAVLDYPNYEVLVIDNNTPDEKTWRPIEKLCRELGPRFRFYPSGKLARVTNPARSTLPSPRRSPRRNSSAWSTRITGWTRFSARNGSGFHRSAGGLHPGSAGLPGFHAGILFGGDVLLVRIFLRSAHAGPQRAQRHHLLRDNGLDPQVGPAGDRRLE